MAGIVRSGARRLAGSALLQRAQTSASFPARSISSHELEQLARRGPSKPLSEALDEIQVRKEELYDLISLSEATDGQERQLLKSLSTQIRPRPDDFRWRKMRALEVTKQAAISSITLTGSLLACLAMFELQLFNNAENKKKQQQEADAAAAAKEEKVAQNVQALLDANSALQEQVKALGGKP